MAKVKAFDPSKAREDAQATIDAAEKEIARLQEKVEPAEQRVTDAQAKQREAAAAKQKQVDAAESKLAEIQEGIAEQEVLIQRAQAFLNQTANLETTAAAVEAAPQGEVIDEPVV